MIQNTDGKMEKTEKLLKEVGEMLEFEGKNSGAEHAGNPDKASDELSLEALDHVMAAAGHPDYQTFLNRMNRTHQTEEKKKP